MVTVKPPEQVAHPQLLLVHQRGEALLPVVKVERASEGNVLHPGAGLQQLPVTLTGTYPQFLPALVQAGYLLVHVWVGVRVVGFLLLGHLVQGVHVGLLSRHLLLEALIRICVNVEEQK